MLQIDPRAGSGEREYRVRGKIRHDEGLAKPLREAPYYLKVEDEQLAAGDICFIGNGPGGDLVPIGIEYKKLKDVLQCIQTGRFSDVQLPAMQDCYHMSYLLIEGRWRAGKNGELQRLTSYGWKAVEQHGRKQPWQHKALSHWIETMRTRAGIIVDRTDDRDATLTWIKEVYVWWTANEYESHRAHLQPFVPQSPHGTRPSRVIRMFKESADGIGWDKAAALAQHFHNIDNACKAPESEWLQVPGIGPTLARKAIATLRGNRLT